MSIFSSILDKIFHRGGATTGTPPTPTATAPTASTPAAPAAPTATTPTTPTPTPSTGATASAPAQPVDVEGVLEGLAAGQSQKLNWRTSIVDLMKLLGLDSSLSNRQALAKELQYSGDLNDSAAMNVWLHRQVMNKLAANGGRVPAELKD